MGRKKKVLKPKEPIRLRNRLLKNGNRSLYLDKYIDGAREYEYLKMYLIPEVSSAAKLQNEETMKAALAIKAQRMIEHTNNLTGAKCNTSMGKMLLLDWLQVVRDKKLKYGFSGGRAKVYGYAIKHIAAYIGNKKVRLCDVDKNFLLGFIDYLASAKIFHRANNKVMGKATADNYYKILKACLKEALRCGYIPFDPTIQISAEEKKNITPTGETREYLNIEEVKMIQKVKPRTKIAEKVKQAFLFSCFTGLRISDVRGLLWSDIKGSGNGREICKKMEKTQKMVYVPLSSMALGYLPQKEDGKELVFDLPKQAATICRSVKSFCKMAGIKKNVTFHTARHTFATMCLTSGTDIYTTSKLLGHSKVTTTQIYADIINQKKVDAVNMISDNFKD